MSRIIHSFDPTEDFIVGTVGEPGNRTFFLQAQNGTRLVSVALEKSQVAGISERFEFLLKEFGLAGVLKSTHSQNISAELHQPLLEEFRVGVIALSWLSDRNMFSLTLQAVSEDDEENEEIQDDDLQEAPDLLRMVLTPSQAAKFCVVSALVMSAGRLPCPFCGLPLDPRGHLCPRANGYRR